MNNHGKPDGKTADSRRRLRERGERHRELDTMVPPVSQGSPSATERAVERIDTAHATTTGRAPADSAGQVISAAVAKAMQHALDRPLAAGLHLVATPIGQLADITLRALAVLARADHVYCEDTRVSRVLLSHFGIDRPLRTYHDHNGERERPVILDALADGRSVALISDAGTPLVSDPGYKLVAAAAAAGHAVYAAPGASGLLAALVSGGLPTDTFLFAGFLPAKAGARRSRIASLAAIPATLIFYEAPGRLAETLSALQAGLGDRRAVVARELTKLHEEVRRGSLGELAGWAAAGRIRGEIVVVVAPPDIGDGIEIDDESIVRHLDEALRSARLADAARAVADRLGVPRARVYDIGLMLKAADHCSPATDDD